MKEDVKKLLEDILDWMGDNDYESGDQGSQIYSRISEELEKNKNETIR